jgi:hypothetical protein
MDDCLKPLSFGMVYYIEIDHWNKNQQRILNLGVTWSDLHCKWSLFQVPFRETLEAHQETPGLQQNTCLNGIQCPGAGWSVLIQQWPLWDLL